MEMKKGNSIFSGMDISPEESIQGVCLNLEVDGEFGQLPWCDGGHMDF